MIEQAIKEILGGDATITASVGTRIRPFEAAQGEARPFLSYQITQDEKVQTYSGSSDYSIAMAEIGIVADSIKTIATIGRQIKTLMNGVAITTSTVRIAPSTLDDETDDEAVREAGTKRLVYVRVQTYRMLYKTL